MEVRHEEGTRFASSILFLHCNLYTQYMQSVGSADQYLPESV